MKIMPRAVYQVDQERCELNGTREKKTERKDSREKERERAKDRES